MQAILLEVLVTIRELESSTLVFQWRGSPPYIHVQSLFVPIYIGLHHPKPLGMYYKARYITVLMGMLLP